MRKTFLTNEDEKRFVKSINGLEPDDNGNVQIDTAGSGTPEVGIPGKDGGYYTPEITQPEAGKMQIEWTASRDDMPAVEPQSVVLPSGADGKDYVLTDTDKQEIAELAAHALKGSILFTPQDLTSEQQAQARLNIGACDEEFVRNAILEYDTEAMALLGEDGEVE